MADKDACFHNIKIERRLKNTAEEAALEFSVPPSSDYFDGHFPDFKLLSSVAQLDLVMHFASLYFGAGMYVVRSKRIKFSQIVRPGITVRLELEYDACHDSLSFRMQTPDGTTLYSAGTLILGRY